MSLCPKYVCNSNLPEDVCMTSEQKIDNNNEKYTEYNLKACQNDTYCDITPGVIGYCNNSTKLNQIIPKSTLLLPGNKCTNHTNCLSNDCHNQICTGKYKDSYCEDHSECNAGLFCNEDNMCEEQMSPGAEGCEEDFNCINTAGCLNNQCVSYFSKANGEVSNSDLFCTSGYSYQGVCAKGPEINNKAYPYKCEINSTYTEKCVYESEKNSTFYLDCQCGINNKEFRGYCPLSPGNYKYSEYFSLYLKFLHNSCHTLARNNPEQCNLIDISDISYIRLKIKAFAYFNHHLLQKNRQCMKETVLYNFYHQITQNSSSLIIDISYILLFLILFI